MIKTLRARCVYENDYVRVHDDEVEFPSGRRGTYYYQRWKSPHGVAVLPVAGRPASRRLYALVRAGTETDPGIAAVLGALQAAAAERSDGTGSITLS